MSEILVNTVDNQPIEVYWQDEVELQLDLNLMYIKSGQKEIQDYVDNVSKPEINAYINDYSKPIVTEVVNTIAEPLVNEYIETETKPSIDEYVNGLKPSLQNYVNQASNYANNSQTSAKASAASSATALTSANNAKTSETNAKTSETNALSSKNAAASSATAASGSANNAKIWAEGTDSQVQALGGTKSAKGWAEDSTNLDYTNITNCITEIPQDIKLELVDGTVTLKAGSKVYVPNGKNADGSNRFDVVTTTQDYTENGSSQELSNIQYYLVLDNTTRQVLGVGRAGPNQISSGTTPPTSGIFYNTSTNSCNIYNSGSITYALSFPICTGTDTTTSLGTGYIISIDQVFDGFGYIGSTVFALPGVKGLIPNGRNADGSLKNEEFTTTSVLTVNVSGSVNNYSIVLNNSSLYALGVYQEVDKPVSGYINYIESENYIYNGLNQRSWTFVGSYNTSSGKITSFTPKTAFHAVDYNDYAREVDNTVHKTGNETINGIKTFDNNGRLVLEDGAAMNVVLKSTQYDVTDKQPEQHIGQIHFRDKNNRYLGWIDLYFPNTTSQSIRLIAQNKNNNVGIFGLVIDDDGYSYAQAPTPSALASSLELVNAEWIRKTISSIITPDYSAGITIPQENAFPYTAPSDGVLLIAVTSYNNVRNEFFINGNSVAIAWSAVSGAGTIFYQPVYMKKGETVTTTRTQNAPVNNIFYPMKGTI